VDLVGARIDLACAGPLVLETVFGDDSLGVTRVNLMFVRNDLSR